MRIFIKVNNLVYDSENNDCKCILSDTQGKLYAFIQVLDGDKKKYYWGSYDHDSPEKSIKAIMEYGGKWPSLSK